MILLDTDIFTLILSGHERARTRMQQANDVVLISVVTQIEVLRGRFESVIKAADSAELLRAANRLKESAEDLARFDIVAIDARAAAEFDRLRENKKLKKIGRADLLIACVALGNRAKLVTRNVRHFGQIPSLRVENWAD